MARNRIGLKFEGWTEYMDKLDKLGGTSAMKKGVDEALKASKEYVNPQIEKAMTKLPAGGKYSKGGTLESLDKDMSTEWSGYVGEIKVGFDFKKSGLKSIFLMYGTPRMKPVSGLKSTIYGAKTKKEIAKLQENEVNKVIKEIMEGK